MTEKDGIFQMVYFTVLNDLDSKIDLGAKNGTGRSRQV